MSSSFSLKYMILCNKNSILIFLPRLSFLPLKLNTFLESYWLALDGVAQLVGCHPVNQNVVDLTPGQGTCLGCRFSPQQGSVQEATDQCFSFTSMFLSLSFSLCSSLSRTNTRKKAISLINGGNKQSHLS